MKDMVQKARSSAKSAVQYLRGNFLALFIVALIVGGVVKVAASEFVTIGYGDYLVEQHKGFDFAVMQDEVRKKQEEAQARQAESGGDTQGAAALPTGAACGS